MEAAVDKNIEILKDKIGNFRGTMSPDGKFWPGLFTPNYPFDSKAELESYSFNNFDGFEIITEAI